MKALDGRHLRSERAREKIIAALLELIDDGELRPGMARIAQRAGVSLRTLFHHFPRREALIPAAALAHLQVLLPSMEPVDVEAPFEARLASFVTQRSRLLERLGPVRRAVRLVEPFSAELGPFLANARAFKRGEVEAVFEKELSRIKEPERARRNAALGVFTSFETWDSLRSHQGLPVAVARDVLRDGVRLLLRSRGR